MDAGPWLQKQLSTGARRASEVFAAAAAAGVTPWQVRAARERLGVLVTKAAFGEGWMWSLPEGERRCGEDAAKVSEDAAEDAGPVVAVLRARISQLEVEVARLEADLARRPKPRKRSKPVQPELPAIPPKPPREPSYEETFYAQFQDSRRLKLESMGVDFVPDKPLHPAGQVVAIRSLLARCNGDEDARQEELIALMKAFLRNEFAATQEPPYPFQLLAYSKNFTPRLLAELRDDARVGAH